jgi:ABC-type uncharacterized transport system permease subunit
VLTDVLSGGVRIGAPIGTAALGEAISERAGVLNIHLEGMMLAGAFASVAGTMATGSPWLGLLFGMAAGALLGALHALSTITFGADQIVSGIALNLVALGLTSFLLPVVFGDNVDRVAGFDVWAVPLLHEIPLLGPVLFEQAAAVYVFYALIPVTIVVLRRTTWGLRVQASGENPDGADAVGVDVRRVRFQAAVLAGVFAGLAGGILALAGIRVFVEEMTAGRGFVALAAVIFGNWSPGRVALAACFFGTVDALQVRLQAEGAPIPGELMTALPYIATLVILAGFVGRSRMPSQLARAYRRGG